jgi:hypothetical protein
MASLAGAHSDTRAALLQPPRAEERRKLHRELRLHGLGPPTRMEDSHQGPKSMLVGCTERGMTCCSRDLDPSPILGRFASAQHVGLTTLDSLQRAAVCSADLVRFIRLFDGACEDARLAPRFGMPLADARRSRPNDLAVAWKPPTFGSQDSNRWWRLPKQFAAMLGKWRRRSTVSCDGTAKTRP